MAPTRRLGLALVATVGIIVAGYLLLPVAVRLLIAGLDLLMLMGVWLAASGGTDASASTILWALASATFAALASTRALAVLAGRTPLGAAPPDGLQRLLGFDEEGYLHDERANTGDLVDDCRARCWAGSGASSPHSLAISSRSGAFVAFTASCW